MNWFKVSILVGSTLFITEKRPPSFFILHPHHQSLTWHQSWYSNFSMAGGKIKGPNRNSHMADAYLLLYSPQIMYTYHLVLWNFDVYRLYIPLADAEANVDGTIRGCGVRLRQNEGRHPWVGHSIPIDLLKRAFPIPGTRTGTL